MAELLVIDKRRLGSEGVTTRARRSLSQQSAAISVGKSAGNTAAIVGAQSRGQTDAWRRQIASSNCTLIGRN
jgi:hypothetical protein